ncbi:hypothetical protein BDZ45DRAFT_730002 [Acephala macrosclerotiorum]|nr:hypothetical protein BDZ45DRAFT_730002 [Acephala macrosclerotiorum]
MLDLSLKIFVSIHLLHCLVDKNLAVRNSIAERSNICRLPGCDTTGFNDPDVPTCEALCAPASDACSGGDVGNGNVLPDARRSIRSSSNNADSDAALSALHFANESTQVYNIAIRESHLVKRIFQVVTQAQLPNYVYTQFITPDANFGAVIPPGYFWEVPSWASDNQFSQRVLNWISGTGSRFRFGVRPALNVALFNAPNDNTRVFIMHPRRARNKNYRTKLPQLKTALRGPQVVYEIGLCGAGSEGHREREESVWEGGVSV